MFVLKYTVQDDELFATSVGVCREVAAGGVADDRGGAGDFATDTIQHPPVDALHRGGLPIQLICMDHNPAGEVGIQFHRLFLSVRIIYLPVGRQS